MESFSERWRPFRRCHRRPRTTQERRANQHGRHSRDEGVWWRGRRSMKTLVDAWDDLMIGKQHWQKHKTWKLIRKQQWRVK